MSLARWPRNLSMLRRQVLSGRSKCTSCSTSSLRSRHNVDIARCSPQNPPFQQPQRQRQLASSRGLASSAVYGFQQTQLRYAVCHAAAAVAEQTDSAAEQPDRTPFERLGVDSRLVVSDCMSWHMHCTANT